MEEDGLMADFEAADFTNDFDIGEEAVAIAVVMVSSDDGDGGVW